ncbi:Rha family transcriptional regulator [Paenibacillus gorillae]|uniref:Rha family transcriptional regulator n=1 Tax=Paenibacillus gorillae TaxID=1243662 RepID=UPI0004B3F8A2|nr:Rha family transcriptional regulator [Paenibacillus gorillae]
MNQLKIVNQNNQLLVDSREVAEMTGKQHKDLLRDIRNYNDVLLSANLRSVDFFIGSTYQDNTGRTLPAFLLTRKGCDMVANKMTGEKGVLFTAAYVTEFERMERAINDPYASLSPELRAVLVMDTKVQQLESRIEEVDSKIETQIRLNQGEQRRMQKAVSSRIYKFSADREERGKMFQELYREIKDRWGVPSYRDVSQKDMQDVIRYIDAWFPKKVTA